MAYPLATICDQTVGSLASPDVVSFHAINLGNFINLFWLAFSPQVLFHTLRGNPSKPTHSACCPPGVHVGSGSKQQGCWEWDAAVWGKIRIPTQSKTQACRAGAPDSHSREGDQVMPLITPLCDGYTQDRPLFWQGMGSFILTVCLSFFLIGL